MFQDVGVEFRQWIFLNVYVTGHRFAHIVGSEWIMKIFKTICRKWQIYKFEDYIQFSLLWGTRKSGVSDAVVYRMMLRWKKLKLGPFK